jgi:hypothetical protein
MKKFLFPPVLVRLLLCVFVLSGAGGARAASTYAYALLGDAGHWNSLSASVEKSARDAGVREGILIGDNLYDGNYDRQWATWFRDGFTFPVVAIGNHNGGYPEEIAYFKMPGEAYSRFIAPGVAAIVLNSDDVGTAGQQAQFLEKELREISAKSIFIVFHHPMLSLTAHHPWTERAAFHNAVRPVIYKYRSRISAVLNGHDHVAGAFSLGTLPVIVSGAVQEAFPFTWVKNVQLGFPVKTEWAYRGVPSWGRLTVTANSDESTVDFIEAHGTRVACTVRIKTGQWLFLEDNCYHSPASVR